MLLPLGPARRAAILAVVLVAALVGSPLSFQVDAAQAAGAAAPASVSAGGHAASLVPEAGTLTAAVPEIRVKSYPLRVGDTLTATAGTWGPEPVVKTYQWNRLDTLSGPGIPIPGATGISYTLSPDDFRYVITVTVTGAKEGFAPVSKTSLATPLILGPLQYFLTYAPEPKIAGFDLLTREAPAGQELAVTTEAWQPAPVNLTYQWIRSTGVSPETWTPIPGATQATYTPLADDIGQKINVTVTGHKPGYFDRTVKNYSQQPIVGGPARTETFTGSPTAAIAGTPRDGQVLSASTGGWGSVPAAPVFYYQWSRDGAPIAGATKSFYGLGPTDIRSRISVTVTGTSPGYVSKAVSSVPTSQVTAVDGTIPPAVDRLSGSDRYSTAVAVSNAAFPTTANVVYLAAGTDYPDALAAAPAAAKEGGPLLLTAPAAVPASTMAEIARLKPAKIVVVGGTAAVSATAFDAVRKIQPNTVRRSGKNRFETAIAVARGAFPAATTAYVVSGADYPDAVSASAPAGAAGAPVLLASGQATSADAALKSVLTDLKVTRTVLAGGPAVLSSGIEASLKPFGPVRTFGADRFATSRALNAGLAKAAQRVYLATADGFADALAGAAVAGTEHVPMYVARTTCIPAGILADIKSSPAERLTLLGGTASLSDNVARLGSCG